MPTLTKQFDRAARDLYLKATPGYVGMVYTDSLISALDASDAAGRDRLVKDRQTNARAIEAAWQAFDDEMLKQNNSQAFLWALRMNTSVLRRVGEFDGYQAADKDKYGLAEHTAFITKQLDKVLPALDPVLNTDNKTRLLIDLETTRIKASNEKAMDGFEQGLKQFVAVSGRGTNDEKVKAARTLEPMAATLSLFTCGGSFACNKRSPQPQSYAETIEALLKSKVSREFSVPDGFDQNLLNTAEGTGLRTRNLFLL